MASAPENNFMANEINSLLGKGFISVIYELTMGPSLPLTSSIGIWELL